MKPTFLKLVILPLLVMGLFVPQMTRSEDLIKVPESTPLPNKDDLRTYIIAVSKQWNIPPCYAITIATFESQWDISAIGHDENFNDYGTLINARLHFLRTGRTYQGIPLKVVMPMSCTGDNRQKCIDAAATTIKDDDVLTSEGPDYGIDWHYSHGFGIGQSTIFGDSRCPDGNRGIDYLGRCFTVPELMTVEGGVEAMVRRLVMSYKLSPNNPAKIFASYRGGGDTENSTVKMRVNVYETCAMRGGND